MRVLTIISVAILYITVIYQMSKSQEQQDKSVRIRCMDERNNLLRDIHLSENRFDLFNNGKDLSHTTRNLDDELLGRKISFNDLYDSQIEISADPTNSVTNHLSGNVEMEWERHFASGLAPSNDKAIAMAMDKEGNVYITGSSTESFYGSVKKI